MTESSIKVGVITDQTGPLSFLGIANANVAKMVVNDINAKGGLLGGRSICTSRTVQPQTVLRKPRPRNSPSKIRST